MAETNIYLNNQYAQNTSTNTIVGYVDEQIKAAQGQIVESLDASVNLIVDTRFEDLDIDAGAFALKEDTYTKTEVDLKIAEIPFPDMSDVALTSDLLNYSPITHQHNDYALKTEIPEIPDMSSYVTNDDLSNELAGYSTVGHLHSIYALKEEIPEIPDMTLYATKEEIEDFKKIVYITQEDYNDLVEKEEETLYIITDSSLSDASIDLSNYYTKDEIDSKNYKSIIYISQQDYEDLVDKDASTLYIITDSSQADIDLTNYYDKNEVDSIVENFKPIVYITTQDYEDLVDKDASTLYIITDSSQDASIDLSAYKPITYLTTQEYEELQDKDENILYILTDSSTNEVDLSDYPTRDEILQDYYDKTTIDSSISAIENTFANYYDKTTIDSSISIIDSSISALESTIGDIQTILASI